MGILKKMTYGLAGIPVGVQNKKVILKKMAVGRAGIPVEARIGVQNKKVILKKDGGRPGWRSSGNSNRRAKQKRGS
jgi:hypothetical protein